MAAVVEMPATRRGWQARVMSPDPVPLPGGFACHVANIGIKDATDDFVVIAADAPCSAAAVFTRSRFAGPSVTISRAHVADGRLRAFAVISKNANVANGPGGDRDAGELASGVAAALGCAATEVLIASTGVIGRRYPMERIRRHLAGLTPPFPGADAVAAARAIMTTDTVPKVASAPVGAVPGGPRVVGIAKGVGMIEPDMATLITLFVTDAEVDAAALDVVFRRVMDRTFNALSIDTDTSTSDTAAIMASGRAGPVDPAAFEAALHEVALSLTRQVARDGEGATTLIEVRVDGATDEAQAKRVGKAIVNSPLVKTAINGADPNWGRVAMAIGKCSDDIDIDQERVVIRFGAQEVYPQPVDEAGLAALAETMRGDEVLIHVSLGIGSRRVHGVRVRPVRSVRAHQRGLHDVTGPSGAGSPASTGPSLAEAVAALPRARLATLPTPLEEGPRLPGGARLWVKRDDLTGLGMGGNKARKLELLCGAALAEGADTLVTVGAGQSNHCRMTAAAGARLGLPVHLVLGGGPPAQPTGNQLLSALFGAELHFVDTTILARARGGQGRARRPRCAPTGGVRTPSRSAAAPPSARPASRRRSASWRPSAEATGCRPRAVVHATSSGGTHAGLLAGRAVLAATDCAGSARFAGPLPEVIGVAVAKGILVDRALTEDLAHETLAVLGWPDLRIEPEDVVVDGGSLGADYAVPTDEGDAALRWAAVHGGWVLDRVYTAKAFAGLLALAAAGRWGEGDDVVFWHTGGQPALFAPGGAPVTSSLLASWASGDAASAPGAERTDRHQQDPGGDDQLLHRDAGVLGQVRQGQHARAPG